jgi:hypothetical protein
LIVGTGRIQAHTVFNKTVSRAAGKIPKLAPSDFPIANCRSLFEEGRQVKPHSPWLLRWELQASFLRTRAISHEDLLGAGTSGSPSASEGAMSQGAGPSYPLVRNQNLCYATHTFTIRSMREKSNQQTIRLSAVVSGHIIDGTVSFSPAPQPGVLLELAKFEARRILTAMVQEEIEAGRL